MESNKEQGIHRDPTDEAKEDDAAEINEGGFCNCTCCGSECHIAWHDD